LATHTKPVSQNGKIDVRLPIEMIQQARGDVSRLKLSANREEIMMRMREDQTATVLNALTFHKLGNRKDADNVFVVMHHIFKRCNIFSQLKQDIAERTHVMFYGKNELTRPYIADYEVVKLCEYFDDYDMFKEDPYACYLAKNSHQTIFSSLEKFAALQNVAMDKRVLGNLVYNMQNTMNAEGHTCVPLHDLCDATRGFMQGYLINVEQKEAFQEIDLVQILKENKRFYLYEQCCENSEESRTFVYLFYVWEKETYIYIIERLCDYIDNGRYFKCADGKAGPGEVHAKDIVSRIEIYEQEAQLPFNARQKQAILNCLGTEIGMNILTGLPGTGKSRVIACVKDVGTKMGKKVLLSAPTGKASQRLGEEACTLHRLLDAQYSDSFGTFAFKKNDINPISCDILILIVDESSMVDFTMFFFLMKACPKNLSILWVGDPHQLPPVGFGDVFHSLVQSKAYPIVHLNKVYRQGEKSMISMLSRCIVKGIIPSMEMLHYQKQTFFFSMGKNNNPSILEKIAMLYKKYGNQAVILSPMRKGPLGTSNINAYIHQMNLGAHENQAPYENNENNENKDGFYRHRERVIVSSNTYVKGNDGLLDVNKSAFNGDMGYFHESNIDEEGHNIISVFIEEGGFAKDSEKKVRQVDMERDAIDLGHACTVHKMQGAEMSVVILVMNSYHQRMLHNRLFYTAVSRAKQKLFIIGDEDAIIKAVETPSPPRYELIKERLLSSPFCSL